MGPKKIAYLTHTVSYGGASISLFLLQKSLLGYPVEKYLITTKIEQPELLQLLKITINK